MALSSRDDEEVLRRFEYRTPTEDQVSRMVAVRAAFQSAARVLLERIPPTADRTVALRALHEANMLANVAIMFPDE